MLDIGWIEILIIAVVALFVVGPKDIPKALRTVGIWVGKLRHLSREFQTTVEDAVRDTEIDEVKKQLESAKTGLTKELNESIDPKGELTGVLSGVNDTSENTTSKETNKTSSAWPLPLSESTNKMEKESIASNDKSEEAEENKEEKSADSSKS
jgi:sec-independent protein translocase protein TatB